jgi:hypothetical protein
VAKQAEVGFEQWVSAAVKNLAGYFNFSGWRIEVAYKDESKDSETCGTSEGCVYAETHVDSAYMTVHITLYKQAKDDFDGGNFNQLSLGLTHELVHVFLDPFCTFTQPHLSDTTAPFFCDMTENQTQRLTMVFMKTMTKEIFPPIPRTKHGKHD